MSKSNLVAVNECGRRIGEDHPNAKLSNADVDEVRHLREDTGMRLNKIAKLFNLTIGGVHKICNYTRRAQTIVGFKKIK